MLIVLTSTIVTATKKKSFRKKIYFVYTNFVKGRGVPYWDSSICQICVLNNKFFGLEIEVDAIRYMIKFRKYFDRVQKEVIRCYHNDPLPVMFFWRENTVFLVEISERGRGGNMQIQLDMMTYWETIFMGLSMIGSDFFVILIFLFSAFWFKKCLKNWNFQKKILIN